MSSKGIWAFFDAQITLRATGRSNNGLPCDQNDSVLGYKDSRKIYYVEVDFLAILTHYDHSRLD